MTSLPLPMPATPGVPCTAGRRSCATTSRSTFIWKTPCWCRGEGDRRAWQLHGEKRSTLLHRVHSQILRRHHRFAPLSEEQLAQPMQGRQLLNLEKGDTLFRQGYRAPSFYFVISGAVK